MWNFFVRLLSDILLCLKLLCWLADVMKRLHVNGGFKTLFVVCSDGGGGEWWGKEADCRTTEE